MGPFADTLFTVLLGWLQNAAQGLWALITGADASAWLRWTLDNWLALVILLCLAGLLVDLMVYLLRWQPWRVWRSFYRSLRHQDSGADKISDSGRYRQWVYADGSTRIEEVPPEPAQPDVELPPLTAPIRRVRRAPRVAAPEESYNQPYYPPQWQGENTNE